MAHPHPDNPLVLEDDWYDEFDEADAREEALSRLCRSHPLEGDPPSQTVVRPGPAGHLSSTARGEATPAASPAGADDNTDRRAA